MPAIPPITGIHHLKIAVSDLQRSLDFYERAFGAARIPKADHHRHDDGTLYAFILEVPGLGCLLELRKNSDRAIQNRGFDPVTIGVPDQQSLQSWAHHLDAIGIDHSGVVASIQAWLIAFDDPDGTRLRLYTLETHGPEIAPEEDNPWVANG